jgi:colanic acid/amylovoran biosynthesis glycosyltransferase
VKVIIFDGTFYTTTFINRLIKGLTQRHELYVLGFNENLIEPLANVNYIKLGSNTNKLSFILTTFQIAFSSSSIKIIFKTLKLLTLFEKKKLQQQNFDLVIKKIRPDIIHAQWVSNIPLLENTLSNQTVPVVFSQRGFHINVRPFINNNNYKYLKQWFPLISGFHSVSKAISKKGDLIYSSPDKINHVVYTGLNINQIKYNTEYKKSPTIKIISVGRNHWKKGYDYALKCCSILKEKGVSFSYEIVGMKNEEELLFLRAFLKLEDHVNFIDALTLDEVYRKVQSSDVFLLPSIEEGIANVAVEAMALGTPVISTNCGGMQELIVHEKEGWVVPTRSPEALANAVINFTEMDEEKLEELRKMAREKVETMFSEEQMIFGMENLYKSCVNEGN